MGHISPYSQNSLSQVSWFRTHKAKNHFLAFMCQFMTEHPILGCLSNPPGFLLRGPRDQQHQHCWKQGTSGTWATDWMDSFRMRWSTRHPPQQRPEERTMDQNQPHEGARTQTRTHMKHASGTSHHLLKTGHLGSWNPNQILANQKSANQKPANQKWANQKQRGKIKRNHVPQATQTAQPVPASHWQTQRENLHYIALIKRSYESSWALCTKATMLSSAA